MSRRPLGRPAASPIAGQVAVTPSGSLAASNVADAILELLGDIEAHVGDTTDAHDASSISVEAISGVAGTDVQTLLANLRAQIAAVGGGPIAAEDVVVTPGNDITSTDVAAALVELQAEISALEGGPVNAANISVTPTGNLAASTVQTALVELQGDADSLDGRLDAAETSVTDHGSRIGVLEANPGGGADLWAAEYNFGAGQLQAGRYPDGDRPDASEASRWFRIPMRTGQTTATLVMFRLTLEGVSATSLDAAGVQVRLRKVGQASPASVNGTTVANVTVAQNTDPDGNGLETIERTVTSGSATVTPASEVCYIEVVTGHATLSGKVYVEVSRS